jgi:hypothetical protein
VTRLLKFAAVAILLGLSPGLDAQVQLVEISNVQVASSLSALVQDHVGNPIPNVVVEEFSSDWKKVLREITTDSAGKFSLAPVPGRKLYYLQLSAYGFNPLRVRVRVDPKRGKKLTLTLEIAT